MLGAARTGSVFAVAPFLGALVAVLLGEPLGGWITLAGVLAMGIGVWLHLGEEHHHEHTHETLQHDHPHRHDDGHHDDHVHDPDPSPCTNVCAIDASTLSASRGGSVSRTPPLPQPETGSRTQVRPGSSWTSTPGTHACSAYQRA